MLHLHHIPTHPLINPIGIIVNISIKRIMQSIANIKKNIILYPSSHIEKLNSTIKHRTILFDSFIKFCITRKSRTVIIYIFFCCCKTIAWFFVVVGLKWIDTFSQLKLREKRHCITIKIIIEWQWLKMEYVKIIFLW